jgi:thiosulfate/3-mercaptopyruvate sulfurtransferase
MDSFGPLVDAGWLASHVADPDVRLLDVRYYLDGRSGREAYDAGHIPGAVFVDLNGDVTGHGTGAGRHPLPEREAFERAMRAAGVSRGSRVVVYDDQGAFVAGRIWCLLRYFGHDAVAVLDGGLQAWHDVLSARPSEPAPGDFVASPPREGMKLDYEAVRDRPADTLLLDARSGPRYRGEVEPVDAKAGHIPGAVNAPYGDNLTDDLRFRSPEELRARFGEAGVTDGADVVVYCGSGVSACNDLLAMEVAGLHGARLYPGSWSDWSSRPDAPVATGEIP